MKIKRIFFVNLFSIVIRRYDCINWKFFSLEKKISLETTIFPLETTTFPLEITIFPLETAIFPLETTIFSQETKGLNWRLPMTWRTNRVPHFFSELSCGKSLDFYRKPIHFDVIWGPPYFYWRASL